MDDSRRVTKYQDFIGYIYKIDVMVLFLNVKVTIL